MLIRQAELNRSEIASEFVLSQIVIEIYCKDHILARIEESVRLFLIMSKGVDSLRHDQTSQPAVPVVFLEIVV